MNSLIIPMYQEQESVPELLAVLEKISQAVNGTLEVVFVLDGLEEATLALLQKSLPKASYGSIVLRHSRNFGSLAAIRSGLSRATRDYSVIMSADLQEPMELIIALFQRLSENKADILLAQRQARMDPFWSRCLSNCFWTFYRRFVQPEMPAGGMDIFGCNRIFREQLLALPGFDKLLPGLIVSLGFRRECIPYQRQPRRIGESHWTLWRKLRMATNLTLAFSNIPAIRILGGTRQTPSAIIFSEHRFDGMPQT